jgi:hypothetical protein
VSRSTFLSGSVSVTHSFTEASFLSLALPSTILWGARGSGVSSSRDPGGTLCRTSRI